MKNPVPKKAYSINIEFLKKSNVKFYLTLPEQPILLYIIVMPQVAKKIARWGCTGKFAGAAHI